jgi:nitrate reductase delta subunit
MSAHGLERLHCGRVDELRGGDLYDLQERYGLLFDRTRSLSLHLFEHVHGESRDRGQAMVDLLKLYQDNAATLTPDPLFVRYYYSHPPATERLARMSATYS